MATTQAFPSSPARPDTPSKHDHPYLIRTTSSSLLTRSNSVGSVHRPSVVVARTPASPALGRSQGRGHRHTKSHSSIAPPLPLPPSAPASPVVSSPMSPEKGVQKASPRRLKRSDTLPTFSGPKPAPSPVVEDLPSNPKLWTSTHLATYLSSALRVKGGGVLPRAVVKDITVFIVERQLSGRVFLRLTPDDLRDMGINQLWRDSLLNASRTLRSNVLQGRIWGFGQAGEADISSFPSTVFEEAGETRGDIKSTSQGTISRARSSKVKSIIAGFERSTSSASSDSGLEADSPLSEAGSLPSPFSFEDSDSMVTSASEIEEKEASTHEVPVEDITKDLPVSQLEETSSVDLPPPSVAAPDVKMQLESDEESTGSLIIHTPPPMYDEEAVVKDAPEDKEQLVQIFTTSSVQNTNSMTYPSQGSLSEATMEKLIANLAPSSISGARAWEEVEDLEPGSTRRRISEPSQYSENNGVSKPSSHVQPIRPQSTLVSLFEPPPLPMSEAQELEVEARERDRRNLALLSELRIRLEEVERRLDEMEAREREFEQIKQAIASATTASLKQRSAAGDQARDGEGQESPNSGELSLTCSKCAAGSGPHNSIQSMELPHEVVKVPKGVQAETDDEDPFSFDPTPAGLPSYVFYVGVGVCAVVFRVMMKKVAGRRF